MMNKTKIQRLDQEALGHIRDLVAEHNADLPQWCARRRRQEAVKRAVLAACIFIGCSLSYSSATATPLYEQITTSSEVEDQHVCDIIQLAIENYGF